MLLFVLAAFIAVLVGAVSCRPALSRYAITPAKMYEGPGAIIWIGLLFGCYWLTIEATPGLNPYAQYIFTFVWAYFAAQFLAGIIERLTGRAGGKALLEHLIHQCLRQRRGRRLRRQVAR